MKTKLHALAAGALSLTLYGCANTSLPELPPMEPYIEVGTGYKIIEPKAGSDEWQKFLDNCKVSAHLELGVEQGPVSYGLGHFSQLFCGAPFNDQSEYSKTEVFVRYKYKF